MAQIKRKVQILKKQSPKKPKWWLWLLLSMVAIAAVVLVVKNFSGPNNQIVPEKIVHANTKADEIIAELQDSTANFDVVEAKIGEAQNAVDEANAYAKTDKEKQVVAEAQAKVDEARKAVDKVKSGESLAAAETSPVVSKDADAQGASEQPGSIPAITTEPKQPDTEKPATMPEQRDGSTTVKTDPSSTSAPTLPQGSLEEKAKRVIRGDFGNGSERKEALGSEYNVIQSKVNEMYRKGEVY